MNSDSANKAHNKVNKSNTLLGTVGFVLKDLCGKKMKKETSAWQLDPLKNLCQHVPRELCPSSRHIKPYGTKLKTNLVWARKPQFLFAPPLVSDIFVDGALRLH